MWHTIPLESAFRPDTVTSHLRINASMITHDRVTHSLHVVDLYVSSARSEPIISVYARLPKKGNQTIRYWSDGPKFVAFCEKDYVLGSSATIATYPSQEGAATHVV